MRRQILVEGEDDEADIGQLCKARATTAEWKTQGHRGAMRLTPSPEDGSLLWLSAGRPRPFP
jgi:hypothetical protein